MCYLIQKHVFIHFFNNQKLLILCNKIDVIGGTSLVKPWLNIYTFLSFRDHSFEEHRKNLRGEKLKGSIIYIKLILYAYINVNKQGTRNFVRISICLKCWKLRKN